MQKENREIKKLEASVKSNFYQSFLPIFDDSLSIDYYHMIVNIDWFNNLLQGWDMKYSTEGYAQYQKQKDKKSCVVGVVGNANKGKSFILQQFTGVKLPTGYSIKTEGLSLKYPVIEDQNLILLDSAGLETPLREVSDCIVLTQIPKKEEADALQKIRNLARDKQLTELFIQTFMITYSNILILVLGILSYSDQKLLNRIKNDMKKGSKLFVIHNLSNFVSVEQVNQYITEILNESLTFTIEEQTMQSLDAKSNQNKKVNKKYFIENSGEKQVIHLLMANENSEAGEYFNTSTMSFLRNQCVSFTDIKSFPVIDKIKEHLIVMSKKLFEKEINETELSLEQKTIKLINRESIELKKCLVDELGFSNFYGNSLTPKFAYYILENKYLVIELEIIGKVERMKVFATTKNENNIFLITGEKVEESNNQNNNKYKSNRTFGHIHLEIQIPVEKMRLKHNKITKTERKNGSLKIYFDIQNKEEEKEQDVEF